ncbi:hypothetical protein NDU88_005827 [Pleurodeles waltl]|uniref:Uncharacterized protein n=1 Tax=Pleurodeles waltl TaxID=8319 RepID=A0AAV7L210_PLEWA|nr:hypothetical protein NDU88_005827 [Pleurodeles waltl]
MWRPHHLRAQEEKSSIDCMNTLRATQVTMCTTSATHIFCRVEALSQLLPTYTWRYKKPESSSEARARDEAASDRQRCSVERAVKVHINSTYLGSARAQTGPRPHAPETRPGHISLIQALDLLRMGSASFLQLSCPRQVQYTTVYAQVHGISTAQCVARVPYVEASSPTGTGGEIQQQLHEHTKGGTGDHEHRISNPHLQRSGGFATGAAYIQVEVQEARVFIRGQGRSCFWQTKTESLSLSSASFLPLFCPRQVQYTTVYAQVYSISTAQCVARVPYVEASSPAGTGGEIQQQLHEHTKGDTGDHEHRISNPHLQRSGGFATGAAYIQVEVQEARVFIRDQSQGRSCFWQTKMAASVPLATNALSAAPPSVNLATPPAAGQDCTVPPGSEALSL